jgi:hypothetical protein
MLRERGAHESGEVTVDGPNLRRVVKQEPLSQRSLRAAKDIQRVAAEEVDEAGARGVESEDVVEVSEKKPRAAVVGASSFACASGGADERRAARAPAW